MLKRPIFIFAIPLICVSTFLIYKLSDRAQKVSPQVNAPTQTMTFSWKKISHGISEAEVTRIAISHFGRPCIYAGTSNAIYRSTAGSSGYLTSLYLEGSRKQVNDLYVDDLERTIYAATDAGLYVSDDEGAHWEKIYASKDSREERCYCVLAKGPRIFLGTSNGLLVTDKKELNWRQINRYFEDKAVFDIKEDERFVYIALASEFYRIDGNLESFVKVLSVPSKEREAEDAQEVLLEQRAIRCVTVASGDPSAIWVVSTSGIFFSNNFAKTWKRISHDSLSLDTISSSAYTKDILFLAGTKGAYALQNGLWQPVYQGSEAMRFNHLVSDSQANVYAATENGAFKLLMQAKGVEQPALSMSLGGDGEDFLDEPSIRDVQKLAVFYAQVDPEKIKNWQALVAKKAWLPKFAIGLGGDKNRTTSDNIYGSYTGGGQSYIGPDDKTFYNNFGWDVSLSWDLGDLIWNADQISIDSRSKLMTELREDILNEVTRLYFERRRLQYEILAIEMDYSQADLEKKMRLEELTALIDALTGGTFSQEIERKRSYEL